MTQLMYSEMESFVGCTWHHTGTNFYLGARDGNILESVRVYFIFCIAYK